MIMELEHAERSRSHEGPRVHARPDRRGRRRPRAACGGARRLAAPRLAAADADRGSRAGRARRARPPRVRPARRPRPGAAARRDRADRRLGAIAERIWYPIWDAGLDPRPLRPHPRRGARASPTRTPRRRSACSTPATSPATPTLTARLREATLAQWRQRGPPPPARAARADHASAGARTASSRSCSTATSRRPAAACATCGCCAASAYAQVADALAAAGAGRLHPPARRARRLHLVAGRRATGCSPRTSTRSPTLLGAARRPDGCCAGGSPTTPAPSRTPSTTRCARPSGGWPPSATAAAGRRRWSAAPVAPRRGRPGRRGGARPGRGHPASPTRPCRCGWPPRPPGTGCASRPATLEWLARRVPAAAPAVAGAGPDRVRPAARLRARRWCPTWEACDRFGLVDRVAAGVGPGPQRARSTTRCTGTPSTGT